jgi:hypothetical protein
MWRAGARCAETRALKGRTAHANARRRTDVAHEHVRWERPEGPQWSSLWNFAPTIAGGVTVQDVACEPTHGPTVHPTNA